jgi:hypothetical protein
MLGAMPSVFIYVVARDFGFAPNPFHGYCTLATCKPGVRNAAKVGDWVIGMGGSRLHATHRCIFAMQVDQKITFDEYWSNPIYYEKKPVRNGSKKMLVGDNIYFRQSVWQQADSHHSNPDGSRNDKNLKTDTSANAVLLSNRFFYFGKEAPTVPSSIISKLGYANVRNYRRFDYSDAEPLIEWLFRRFSASLNQLLGDPFDFHQSARRYSGEGNKVV